jgi:hypothetical protein
MGDLLENNLSQYLLSPLWERIEVRGAMIWTSTPTLSLPHPKGEGIGKPIFIV